MSDLTEAFGGAMERIIREEVRAMLRQYLHLPVKDWAAILSVSESVLYSAIRDGELTSVKHGTRGGVISPDAITEYLEKKKAKSVADNLPATELVRARVGNGLQNRRRYPVGPASGF